VLLKGAGAVLKFSSGPGAAVAGGPRPRARELRRVGDLAEFDGGLATQCDLVDGPCVDLNLMVSKALPPARARVQALREARSLSVGNAQSMLVFAIDAAVELRSDGGTSVLEPWDLALLAGGDRNVHVAAAGGAAGAVNVFLAELPAG
jgi:environmental stress-induced protein Ves